MRALFFLFALFLVLPAVFATSFAQAKIKPIPRPAAKAAKPAVRATKAPARAQAPVARVAARAPRASTTRRLRAATTTRAKRPARVLARSHGGRSAPPSVSHGGRLQPPPLPVAPVAPDPTPLGLVAISEARPSEGDAWPAWMLSLLGVLALSEAFLLLHIVRERVFAEA
jgi:hypothetical protein